MFGKCVTTVPELTEAGARVYIKSKERKKSDDNLNKMMKGIK